LASRLTPNEGERSVRLYGAEFHLDLSDHIQRAVFMGTYEAIEANLLSRNLEAGMVFADVGANVGFYTALAASLVGSNGRVLAFEPSPYAYKRLLDLVTKNQLHNVTPINQGVADRPGRLQLYLGTGSRNHSPTMVAHANTDQFEVPVTTLDEITSELGIDRIDFLKVDVEGFEPRVLAGAHRLLAERRIGGLLVEFNEAWLKQAGTSSEALLAAITQAGFDQQYCYELRRGDNRMFRLSRV
jgi:FkbM family methyltransferase